MTALPLVSSLYIGILALFVPPLILWVRGRRIKAGIGLGHGRHDGSLHEKELLKAVRIHGHFIENVPFSLLLILCAELTGNAPFLIHALGITLIISRVLHAYGLTQSVGKSFGRLMGNILGIIIYVVAGALCILGYFGHPVF